MECKSLKNLIILLLLTESLAKVRMEKVVCTFVDSDFFKVDLCEVKPNKQGNRAIYLTIRLVQVIKNTILNAQLYHLSQKNALLVVNHTWDACAFLRGRKKQILLQIVYNKITKYSNLNHSCPYTDAIYVREYAPEKLSMPVPKGKYLIKPSFVVDGERRLTLEFYVNIV